MRILSLASTNIVITNQNYNIEINIGGGGKLLGSVGYEYDNDMFTVDGTPDGGASASFNAYMGGKITIQLKQTSPHCFELVDFIKWCRANPELASSTITAKDSTGTVSFFATDILPSKIPGNSISNSIADRSFEFQSPNIVTQES